MLLHQKWIRSQFFFWNQDVMLLYILSVRGYQTYKWIRSRSTRRILLEYESLWWLRNRHHVPFVYASANSQPTFTNERIREYVVANEPVPTILFWPSHEGGQKTSQYLWKKTTYFDTGFTILLDLILRSSIRRGIET
jgi:hypothetical protein